MKLIQVGEKKKKKKCFNGCNYFSGLGIHGVTQTVVLACEGMVIALLLRGCQSVSMDSCRDVGSGRGALSFFAVSFSSSQNN